MTNQYNFANRLRFIAALLSASLLSACDGGSSSSKSNPDSNAPSVTVISPTSSHATTSREIVVTGSANDAESGVARISINNVSAQTNDNFSTWSVNLTLSEDIDQLSVTAEDHAGNIASQNFAISITGIESLFSEASSLAFDTISERLIILDGAQKTLFEADAKSPDLSTFLDGNAVFNAPIKILLDTANERLLVLDQQKTRPATQAIFAVDLESKQTTTLINGLQGTIDIAVDDSGDNIYLLNQSISARNGGSLSVFSIDQDSISSISDDTTLGPDIVSPSTLMLHNKHAYLIEHSRDELIRINVETGERIALSSERSDGISLNNTRKMTLNGNGTRAWATDSQLGRIIEIELDSGARKIMSSAETGDGLTLDKPMDITHDAENQRLLVSDTALNVIFTVDIKTGDRDYFISSRMGHGPRLEAPVSIKTVSDELAYVLDEQTKTLLSVNLLNGDRYIISSDNGDDSALLLSTPSDIAIDANSNKAWVIDREQRSITAINLITGARETISTYKSSAGVAELKIPVAIAYDGTDLYISDIYHDVILKTAALSGETSTALYKELSDGSSLRKPVNLTLDPTNQTIFGIDQTQKLVYAVNLSNGHSRTISSATVGSGLNFEAPIDIQINSNQEAYVIDSAINAILKVDLNSGNRSVLSNTSNGSGPLFKELVSISHDTSSNQLFALDGKEKAVFAIDVETGDRRIISR